MIIGTRLRNRGTRAFYRIRIRPRRAKLPTPYAARSARSAAPASCCGHDISPHGHARVINPPRGG